MTPRWHDNDNGIPEEELQAYVDGELDGRRRAAIEAYLATNAAEAVRIAAYRAQNVAMHALFDPAQGGGAVPPRITELARQLDKELGGAAKARRRGRLLRNRPAVAAAAVLLFCASAAGGLALHGSRWQGDPLVALARQAGGGQAGAASPLQLASSVPQTGAEAQAGAESALQVTAWLAALPGRAPARLPDLQALGFELAAERVIATNSGQPAAQLLYQNGEGQRVTLYMRAGGKAGRTGFTVFREGASTRYVWQDSHMAYSLVGKMAQDRLLRIAEAVSRSLQQAAEKPLVPETATPPAGLESAVQSEGDMPATPLEEDGLTPDGPLPEPSEEAAKET
ncbi:hypothetical protein AAFN88_19350 [Pelagibius sp. CAU 1746]|uniref:anti-sigma factor family protein n=1 Tax=Pelagibius sp. CAU 1746 TaxID=3140370 RepID=UPI00325C240C